MDESISLRLGETMPAELLKTALLGEWVIATRSYTKNGITTVPSRNRYPIPEETLKQIAFDFLATETEADGCEKGYMFELINSRSGKIYKVTVERIPFPEDKHENDLQRP